MELCWMNSLKRSHLQQLAGFSLAAAVGSSFCFSSPVRAQAGAAVQKLTIPVLMRADDLRLESRRVERAYLGQPLGPAIEGLSLAIQDSSFELEAARLALQFMPVRLASVEQARTEVQKLVQGGALAMMSELPASWVASVCDAAKVAVINVSEANDELREQQCRVNLFHTYPSERMRTDAIAQVLMARRWNKIFLLHGETADDLRRAEVVGRTLQRFNLKVQAKKVFKLSADPRERQLSNLGLLTSGLDFDALWVVDSDGEFARTVPYRFQLPRPVVGDAGLVAMAWDAHFDRYGAPQVSKSFSKQWKRSMTGHDWAAWLAGRALVTAMTQPTLVNKKLQSTDLLKVFTSNEFRVDGSKGQSLSFRDWDRQLRQPILLSDGQAVIEMAPLEGVLHPRNALDSLGADSPEKLCKAVS
jgi:ABC transporter substrate binding protein (PQQ-dependent alcohol dehydrogenase system)